MLRDRKDMTKEELLELVALLERTINKLSETVLEKETEIVNLLSVKSAQTDAIGQLHELFGEVEVIDVFRFREIMAKSELRMGEDNELYLEVEDIDEI
jgi:hypothetical protein